MDILMVTVITVLKGKVEEIELPVAHVDVIISEWMGYFLLFENMLNTVLYARDKWLINDGVILLDKALLFLTAIEDAEYNGLIPADSVLSHLKRFYCSIGTMFLLPVWNNVYGFDTSCIRKQAMAESLVDTFDSKEMVTSDVLVKAQDQRLHTGNKMFFILIKF